MILPSPLNTGTISAAHFELVTGQYIPNLTNLSSSHSIFCLRLFGTGLAQKCLGVTWGSIGIFA